MPTFRTQRPPGIADSIAALIGSSPNLSRSDIMRAESANAQNEQHLALAEKARAEVEAMREQQRLQQDPAVANEYAALNSGLTVPVGQQLGGYIRGQSLPPTTPMDDEGNTMPAAPYQRPDITPGQENAYRANAGSLIANRLATGKTNADQLTQAGGNLITQGFRQALAQPDLPLQDRVANIEAVSGKAVEPYKLTPQGLLNEMTGAVSQPAGMVPKAAKEVNWQHFTDAAGKTWAFNPATREMQPVIGPDGQPFQQKNVGEKPLPNPAIEKLSGAGSTLEDSTRLTATFKPQYAGHTILGDLSNTYKRIVGDETGQAQWWQDMDALQNQTRHALFGSALTSTELAAWNKTSITPRMEANQVQENLTRRQAIEARAASKLARAYAAGGYNKEQIAELLGPGALYLDQPAPPVTKQNPAAGKIRRPPQEGEAGVSKSGRPTIFQGGRWVYADEAGA